MSRSSPAPLDTPPAAGGGGDDTGAGSADREVLLRHDRLLSWPEVKARVGLSRTSVWRLEREGKFPKRVRILPGRVAWRESEIVAWISGTWTPGEKSS
jgi:prophage regulatory protein